MMFLREHFCFVWSETKKHFDPTVAFRISASFPVSPWQLFALEPDPHYRSASRESARLLVAAHLARVARSGAMTSSSSHLGGPQVVMP